jgi:hypothetical protein
MDEKEFRVLIKHYFLKGKTVKKWLLILINITDSSSLIRIVYKWFEKSRSGHMATGGSEMFQEQLGTVLKESRGIFVLISNSRWNMISLLPARDKRTVKTTDCKWGISPPKSKDCSFSRKGHSHSFLRMLRVSFSLIFWKKGIYYAFLLDHLNSKVKVWFGLGRYGLFFATRGLIRPGPTA